MHMLLFYPLLVGMPYRFKFDGDQTEFQGNLETIRCAEMKPDGARCKCKCAIGTPFCHVHLKYIHHLQIKPSTIQGAGKGVFAVGKDAIIFRNGDPIISYDGQHVTRHTLEERYGPNTAPYGVETGVSGEKIEDAALRRGAGAVCNHATGHKVNARIRWSTARHQHEIVATKIIRNGAEVFVNYGQQYHFDEGTNFNTTSVRK